MNAEIIGDIRLAAGGKIPSWANPAFADVPRKNTDNVTLASRKKRMLLGFLIFIAGLVPGIQASPAETAEQRISLLLSKADEYSKNTVNNGLVLKLCNDAIRLQPQNVDTYYRSALILGRMGDYSNAIRNFSVVIKHDQRNKKLKYPAARKFRADCFMGLGYLQNAVDDYSAIVRHTPTSGKVWFYLAEALALMGRDDLALKAIASGCATKSHWCEKMQILQKKILGGERIIPHKPLSN